MNKVVILDASLGPPYDVPLSYPASSASASPQPLPPPPNAGVVSSCTSRLHIGREDGNYNGVMHGGAAGVIFDMLTTIALGPIARPGFWTWVASSISLSLSPSRTVMAYRYIHWPRPSVDAHSCPDSSAASRGRST